MWPTNLLPHKALLYHQAATFTDSNRPDGPGAEVPSSPGGSGSRILDSSSASASSASPPPSAARPSEAHPEARRTLSPGEKKTGVKHKYWIVIDLKDSLHLQCYCSLSALVNHKTPWGLVEAFFVSLSLLIISHQSFVYQELAVPTALMIQISWEEFGISYLN